MKLVVLTLSLLMIAGGLADAATHKDYPYLLDKPPIKKPCNKIEYFKECSEISHHRGKDYIVFRWHDEVSACQYDTKIKKCTQVSEFHSIMIRNGCLISWCERKK